MFIEMIKDLVDSFNVEVVENNNYIVIKTIDDEDDNTIFNVSELMSSYGISFNGEHILSLVGDAMYWITLNKKVLEQEV